MWLSNHYAVPLKLKQNNNECKLYWKNNFKKTVLSLWRSCFGVPSVLRRLTTNSTSSDSTAHHVLSSWEQGSSSPLWSSGREKLPLMPKYSWNLCNWPNTGTITYKLLFSTLCYRLTPVMHCKVYVILKFKFTCMCHSVYYFC